MGERMARKIFYLPPQMLRNLKTISESDGRDENELMRVALGTFIDAKMVQANVLKGIQTSIAKK